MKMDDVIAAACEELNCSYEANALWFEVLINQAVRTHKSMSKLIEKNVTLEVNDKKTTLPADVAKMIEVYHCISGEKYCPEIDYTIQGDCLIFVKYSAVVDNTFVSIVPDGSKIVVKYFGLYTDEDGVFIVPEDWERMLVAYIGWKYSRRYLKDYGVGLMQNYQREFQTQKLANI
jgi:hypothetical protein